MMVSICDDVITIVYRQFDVSKRSDTRGHFVHLSSSVAEPI